MANAGNTHIDDLAAFGDELADEHLPLVTGGRIGMCRKVTANGTYQNDRPDGSIDVEIDF